MIHKSIRRLGIVAILAGCTSHERGSAVEDAGLQQQAALLGSESEVVRQRALEHLRELPPSDRVRLLRVGLQLRDERASLECAKRLSWNELDLRESERVSTLLLGALPTDLDPDRLAPVLASSDIHVILGLPDNILAGLLPAVESLIRAEHRPQMFSIDRSVGAIAWESGLRDDRYRELQARFGLGDSKLGRATASGFPAVLAAYLDKHGHSQRKPGVLDRWAMESVPDQGDVPLLLALSKQQGTVSQEIAIRGMSRIADPVTGRRLREIASRTPSPDHSAPVFAAGALAQRGELGHVASLQRWASSGDALALAVLLRVAPRRGYAFVERTVYEGDDATRRSFLRTLVQATRQARLHRFPWESKLFAGFADRGIRTNLDGVDLVKIALAMPECRNSRVAKAAASRLKQSAPDRVWEIIDRSTWRVAADEALVFLEMFAPTELRSLLRRWANSRNRKLRSISRHALVTLGDADNASDLVGWVANREVVQGYGGCDLDAHVLLARSPGAPTERFLRQVAGRARSEASPALGGLAALAGLDENAAERFSWRLLSESEQVKRGCDPASAPDDAEFEQLRRLILARRPVDAVVQYLRKSPQHRVFLDVGLIRDRRIRDILTCLRERREHGDYTWITGQLAIMGCRDARTEIWKACVQGRSSWMEVLDVRVLTLNHDHETTPFWISELESNRSRFMVAATILRVSYGFDAELEPGLARPPADRARAWWRANGKSVVWSRLAGRFIPGP